MKNVVVSNFIMRIDTLAFVITYSHLIYWIDSFDFWVGIQMIHQWPLFLKKFIVYYRIIYFGLEILYWNIKRNRERVFSKGSRFVNIWANEED